MFVNPYQNSGKTDGSWLKGNFHTHAGTGEGTCGANSLESVVVAYKDANYGVLTISNHDINTDMLEYANANGLVMFNGYEYSRDAHMLCIDCPEVCTGPHQSAIDDCRSAGGFTILCHPNWQHKEYWPWQDIDFLTGYAGIEIMNGVIFRLNGSGLATDTWDYLLSKGKRVLGFGNDDFHRWHDLAKVYNVIYTQERDKNQVKASILQGCFYVSTGLWMERMTLEEGILRVELNTKNTYVDRYVFRFIGKDGIVLKEQTGASGEYRMTGDEMYVRAEVISEHGAMLWTQPVYREEQFLNP